MATRAFKSISPQELEAVIASAVSAITNTETTVTIGHWKEADFEPLGMLGKDKFELQLTLTVGKSYAPDRTARGSLKDDLDAATSDDDDTIPF
jgi:hypothetical protein